VLQVRPIAVRQWSYGTLRVRADRVFLEIDDPGPASARVAITLPSLQGGLTLWVPARKRVVLPMPLRGFESARQGFGLRATAPVLVARIAQVGHAVRVVYGRPGNGQWVVR
jgi:hypothetical protein